MGNINEVKLDKNYDFAVINENIYSDGFDELTDAILKAKSENLITEEEVSMLLGLSFRVEMKNDIRSLFKTLMEEKRKPEKHTMFVQFNSGQMNHAS